MYTLSSFTTLILIIASIAFFTLLERNILSYSQIRKGPNNISIAGYLQPAGDGVNLFTKESTNLFISTNSLFYLSPIIALILALLLWLLYPSAHSTYVIHFPILLFLCISSISVYATIIAGWSSNANYSLLGALRSVAQTISYEISIALILISTLIIVNTFNILTIISSSNSINVWILTPILLFIWYSTTLAETNRSPYDLAEGESELVSGFNTEYGGPEFALIFMAEYINIIFMATLTTILFFPTQLIWTLSTTLNVLIISSLFITARATLPRLRYDRLISITWTSYLPISLLIILALSPL